MGYSFESRVRYSESGENGCLTLPGILDYFQDCSTFQSDEIGQGVKATRARNRTWVLSSWQVIVNRYPEIGEHIVTATYPYEFKGFIGMRNFTMDTKDGEHLAWANTYWSNINIETGLLERLTEEDTRGYVLEPKLEMDYAPRKIKVPADCIAKEPFQVQKHHLDTNHHVNNCQYIRMAQDFLPEHFRIRQMRAEYKQQAVLQNKIYPMAAYEENKIIISLNDENQSPYAVVEFMKQ
jgi:acyl-ACP thioesterase